MKGIHKNIGNFVKIIVKYDEEIKKGVKELRIRSSLVAKKEENLEKKQSIRELQFIIRILQCMRVMSHSVKVSKVAHVN